MRRTLLVVCSVGFFVLLLCILGLYLVSPMSSSKDQIKIIIEQGETLDSISSKLQDYGIIRSAVFMRVSTKLFFPSYSFKSGEYAISQSEPLVNVIRMLALGAPRKELTILIPEGWSIEDMGIYFQQQKIFSKEDFFAATKKDWSSNYPFLLDSVSPPTLEGFLFPDTYRIFTDATPDDVIRKMLSNFNEKIVEKYRDISQEQNIGFRELITLASIVEREVQSDFDRAIVADLFLRRIKLDMPLQADSTVNYITGKKNPQSTFADIAINSPYNTYRIKGLPPGAICNPGLSSIRAVLYPKKNDYLYFLTTREGSTILSRTFDEHVKNKIRYLKK